MQDLTPYLTPALPDVNAIHAMVAGERPHTSRDGKAVLLHDDFTPWVLTNPPNGQDPSDISEWVIQAKMSISESRDVTTQVDLVLDWALGDQVNTLRAFIQFYTVFYDESTLDAYGNPTVLASFPRCRVGFQIPDRTQDDQGGGDTLTVTGYDVTWQLRDLYLENTFVPPSGMPVTSIVEAMLLMDNLTPHEGGRQPSGVASSGPHSQIPTGDNRYAAPGVFAHTVCTASDVNGYLIEPHGLCIYNPDASILVDPTTHYPIDPWSCLPMTLPLDASGLPDVRYPNTFVSSRGLWFSTHTGAFYRAGYTSGFEQGPVDPFKGTPLPLGLTYYHPDPAHPTQSTGNVPCPLESWPYDWDGSGPYFATGGNAQTSSGGGTNTTSGPGPSTLTIGANATLAKRDGSAVTTLITAGSYNLQPAICSPDPNLNGHSWCQPQTGAYDSASSPVSGYAWPAGTWTAQLNIAGTPVPEGSAQIKADLFREDTLGNLTLLAHLPLGAVAALDGATGINSVQLSCSGAVPAVTASPGDRIVAQITLVATTDITCAPAGNNSAFISVNTLQLNCPQPTVTTTTTNPITVIGGNPDNPGIIWTGTTVPWPDTNNPGMCPSGCDTPGPNLPLARITMTPSTLSLPASTPYGRDTNFLALLNELLDVIIYRHLYATEQGQIQILPQPLFSLDGVPQSVWNFRTDVYQVIKPGLKEKLPDQTRNINKVVVISQNNNRDPMVAMGTNNSASSAISRPNLGRTVMGKPIQDDKIPDADTMQKRVTLELQRAASAQQAVEFTVADVPFLQLYDPIDLYIQRIDGTVTIDSNPYSFFISAIEVDLLDPTSMKITAGRAVPV